MIRLIPALLLVLTMVLPARAATITDDTGRSITFEHPFHRIISLYAAHTENLFHMGLDEEIIGVSKGEDFPSKALEKPVFNAHDGVERFLAADPDLVLIRPMHSKGYPALWRALEKRGVTVLALQPNSVDEMFDYWRTLGKLTGKEIAAEAMVDDFKAGLERVRAHLAEFPFEQRPKVFFESIHKKIATFAPEAMPIFVVEQAGGINIAKDARSRHGSNIANYGLERVLAKGKDIDVYLAQSGAMNKVSVKKIKNIPAASEIHAVIAGNVFLVDEHLVSRPTMRLLTGIETVHQLLHRTNQHH